MLNQSKNCGICLKLGPNLVDISNFNEETNLTWLENLQKIVPEINWLDIYKICSICTNQLSEIYKFRQSCIDLNDLRKQIFNPQNAQNFNPNTNDSLQNGATIDTDRDDNDSFDNKHNLTIDSNSSRKSMNKKSCTLCNKSYKHQTNLSTHLRRIHNLIVKSLKKCFECEKCGKPYVSKQALRKHIPKCQNEKNDVKSKLPKRPKRTFTCEICEFRANFVRQIIDHCASVHKMAAKLIKPYACRWCDNRFASSPNLIQHEKYHEGARMHICSICGKSYITKSDLTVHEYIHFNKRNYKCDICEKAFNTNKNLRSHKLVVHTDSILWKYQCDQCDKRFPLKSGYDQHLRRHAGDKRFACHICLKPFVSRSEMQKHVAFHSNVRNFRCDICGKEYKAGKLYEAHLSRAHGIGEAKAPPRVKKFICDKCPKAYFDKQKLHRHLCMHSGIKPFACAHCEKKFADKYYLRQHLRTSHKIEFDTTTNFT